MGCTDERFPTGFDLVVPPSGYYNGSDNAGGFNSGGIHFNNTFTDFGGGFTESSNITSTNYQLALDSDPAPDGFAQFLAYNQNVNSINLPDGQGGGIDTGAITGSP